MQPAALFASIGFNFYCDYTEQKQFTTNDLG